MITYNNLVTKFQEFVDNHHFLQTFTHGSPSDVDLEKFEVFPLLHLVYTGGTYGDNSKIYNLEIYILDFPPSAEDKVGYQQSALSNSEQIAEDILADVKNGGEIFQFGYYYEVTSANITPLEETQSNVLAGTLLNLAIEVGFSYDSCNAPLDGVDPEGSTPKPFKARGLLRVKEVDGTPDVTSVATMIVPNGSLTDDGDGVISLDFDSLPTGSEGQTLVWTNGAWTTGYPTAAGQVSTFQITGPNDSIEMTGAGATPVDFGDVLAETATITQTNRAGFNMGVNTAVTQFLASPIAVKSTYTIQFSVDIQAPTGGLGTVGVGSGTGWFGASFSTETIIGDGTWQTYSQTSDSKTVTFWQLANVMALEINRLSAPSSWYYRNPSLTITINHA